MVNDNQPSQRHSFLHAILPGQFDGVGAATVLLVVLAIAVAWLEAFADSDLSYFLLLGLLGLFAISAAIVDLWVIFEYASWFRRILLATCVNVVPVAAYVVAHSRISEYSRKKIGDLELCWNHLTFVGLERVLAIGTCLLIGVAIRWTTNWRIIFQSSQLDVKPCRSGRWTIASIMGVTAFVAAATAVSKWGTSRAN